MKKIFSVFLAIILFFITTTAYCEAFSIRNGIKWGMSINEVRNIEEKNSGGKIVEKENELFCYNRIVSGIDGSHVTYLFEDGKLYFVIYELGAYTGNALEKQYNEGTYKMMLSNLTKKYGEPGYMDNDHFFPQSKDIYFHMPSYNLSSAHKLLNYAQWLIPYDDNYTMIHLYFYTRDIGVTQYFCKVYYSLISKEDGDSIYKQIDPWNDI